MEPEKLVKIATSLSWVPSLCVLESHLLTWSSILLLLALWSLQMLGNTQARTYRASCTINWIISKVPTAVPKDQACVGPGKGYWTQGWRKFFSASWVKAYLTQTWRSWVHKAGVTLLYQSHSVGPWQMSDFRPGNLAMTQRTMPSSSRLSTAYWPHHSPEKQ